MKMKKLTAMSMAVMMAATMIPAVPAMAADGGKVYYLNFKPEADEAWQKSCKSLHRRNRNRSYSCNCSIRTV